MRAALSQQAPDLSLPHRLTTMQAEEPLSSKECGSMSAETKDVFISYARKDGWKFARDLRRRLEQERFSVWQDVVSEEAGEKWWREITRAIDGVRYMVLILTPRALASETVRREWAYARRVGTRVIPVVFGERPFTDMPRWIKGRDIINLQPQHRGYQKSWDRLLRHLREPYTPRPVPYMVRSLPGTYVERAEMDSLLQALVTEDGSPNQATVALQGGPGFGKTTLAQAICHHPEIVEVYCDGILWATIGEEGRDILARLTEMVKELTGRPESFQKEDTAAARLHELLRDRECLIVLDDVWDEGHIALFMGQDRSTRLITTRERGIAARAGADPILPVAEMQPEEAVQVLINWLPEGHRPSERSGPEYQGLRDLAARLGEWPLLLRIIGAELAAEIGETGNTLAGALQWVNDGLDEEGLTAFDREDPKQRDQALGASMRASLRRFPEEEQARLFELAIFPPDEETPAAVVYRLWERSGEVGGRPAKKFQEAGRALLRSANRAGRGAEDSLPRCIAGLPAGAARQPRRADPRRAAGGIQPRRPPLARSEG